jgi:hypothetical protein
MGGKRPDQHNIDPGEAGATNYAWRGEGRSQGEKLKDHDKQLERQTETDDLRRVMNSNEGHGGPGQKAAGAGGSDAAKGRKIEKGTDEESGRRDRVDEQSEESFPASDPPQQP